MDLTGRHPGTQAAMRAFGHSHLPPELQTVSRLFSELADQLLGLLPDDPLLVRSLDKLWDSKNRAVLLASLNRPATE